MVVGRTLVKDAFNQEGEAQVLLSSFAGTAPKKKSQKVMVFWAKSFGFWEIIPHSKLFRLLKQIVLELNAVVGCCGGVFKIGSRSANTYLWAGPTSLKMKNAMLHTKAHDFASTLILGPFP